MEVSLRGSYGVQLQPVLRATLSAPLRYSGLARQRRAHCPPVRDYFHVSLLGLVSIIFIAAIDVCSMVANWAEYFADALGFH